MVQPPLSLYIHWPWCIRKCPYCDFSSRRTPTVIPEKEYVDGVLKQIRNQLDEVGNRRLISIFIGGGTPSLMSEVATGRLIEGINSLIPFANDIEITLEANPGTFEFNKFKGFRQAGINRLSVGVQSFDDSYLKFLGRIHSSEEAKRALSAASGIFENFNVDLMFGLPHQTTEQVVQEWRTALAFGPSQISYYQLTIEEGTVFGRNPPRELPDSDQCASLQLAINEAAQKSNFDHYEISAFAKSDKKCRHNVNYWEFGDYLGAGPAAHGKLTQGDSVLRTESFSTPSTWLESLQRGDGFKRHRVIQPKDLVIEFMMNALRLREGVPFQSFEERTGNPFTAIKDRWFHLQSLKLVEPPKARLQTTPIGWAYLNDVLESFID